LPDNYSSNFEPFLHFQELEKSKFATQALDLSKLQEETRQQEQMVKIKEYEAHIEQLKIDQKRVDGEQRRKNMEEEGKQAKYKAEYQVID
jgi:ATPase family AAA domain-containing protein 3A/B